jgi:hypothetical protein
MRPQFFSHIPAKVGVVGAVDVTGHNSGLEVA